MANNRKDRKKPLPDLGIQPQVDPRLTEPPPARELDEVAPWQIWLDEDQELVVRQVTWRGQIFDFSINHTIKVAGKRRDIARIDCCHQVVHRHQFVRSGKEAEERYDICPIPEHTLEALHVVNDQYAPALDCMHDNWEEHYRRWNR